MCIVRFRSDSMLCHMQLLTDYMKQYCSDVKKLNPPPSHTCSFTITHPPFPNDRRSKRPTWSTIVSPEESEIKISNFHSLIAVQQKTYQLIQASIYTYPQEMSD